MSEEAKQKKWPYISWFVSDWLGDPKVSLCEPATRGILFDWLCNMHALDRSGQVTGTRELLARLGRCTVSQCDAALLDLKQTNAAEVAERNGVVTVINRRMKRAALERKCSTNRQQRHRTPAGCHGAVTGHVIPSPSPSPEGGEPPARLEIEKLNPASEPALPEVPSLEEAVKSTMTAGIPDDFARFVYSDWSSRSGKDAGGVVVGFLPYVTKRWARERVEWKNGKHRGRQGAVGAEQGNGPKLAEVRKVVQEKHSGDARAENWAVSFHSHWSKRGWQRNDRTIDWQVELSAQLSKWRVAK